MSKTSQDRRTKREFAAELSICETMTSSLACGRENKEITEKSGMTKKKRRESVGVSKERDDRNRWKIAVTSAPRKRRSSLSSRSRCRMTTRMMAPMKRAIGVILCERKKRENG